MMLGDSIQMALGVVGVTSDRVTTWLGRPCRCPERVEQLNRLGCWAIRVLKGKTAGAVEQLEAIMGEEDDESNPCVGRVLGSFGLVAALQSTSLR